MNKEQYIDEMTDEIIDEIQYSVNAFLQNDVDEQAFTHSLAASTRVALGSWPKMVHLMLFLTMGFALAAAGNFYNGNYLNGVHLLIGAGTSFVAASAHIAVYRYIVVSQWHSYVKYITTTKTLHMLSKRIEEEYNIPCVDINKIMANSVLTSRKEIQQTIIGDQ